MGLKACKECGQQISDSAESCPHCGHKPSRPSGCFVIILGVIIVFVVGVVFESYSPPPPKTAAEIEADTVTAARGACRAAILQVLNDPDSAEFVGQSTESYAEKMPDGTWTVQRTVRAKNAFNAYRLAVFECRLANSGDGTWRGLSVKQIDP